MKTFASNIAQLSCPSCAEVQSLWRAQQTLRFPLGFGVNRFLTCAGCGNKLKLTGTCATWAIWALRLCYVALGIALIILFLLGILMISSTFLSALAGMAAAWILSFFFGSCLSALHARYCYKLEFAL